MTSNFDDDFEVIEDQISPSANSSSSSSNKTSTKNLVAGNKNSSANSNDQEDQNQWDSVENIVFFEEMGFLSKGDVKQIDLKVCYK